jgi:transketolase
MDYNKLVDLAYNARADVIQMATNNGSFVGSAFSCMELIVFLYERYLNLDKILRKEKERDILLLSKGHAVCALYAYLVEKQVLPKSLIIDYNSNIDSSVYIHPNHHISCIEFNSGSLGHMLSIATGIAIFRKRNNVLSKNVVILGDGELDEGSVWESLMIASSQKLDNLILIVDRNYYQANFCTEDLVSLEPLADKFRSFGAHVCEVNGHSFEDLDSCFKSLVPNDKPIVIIANTIRGKGVTDIENKWDQWFIELSKNDAEKLSKKLYRVD